LRIKKQETRLILHEHDDDDDDDETLGHVSALTGPLTGSTAVQKQQSPIHKIALKSPTYLLECIHNQTGYYNFYLNCTFATLESFYILEMIDSVRPYSLIMGQ
jgi:hypothetical protein